MTYNEALKIMQKCNISPHGYCIGKRTYPLAETALCLDKKGGKFRYFAVERNVVVKERLYKTEDEASMAFLRDMARHFKSVKEYMEKR